MGTSEVEALFYAAQAAHQAGRLSEAEAGYRQVLLVSPSHLGARHLLGVAALQAGRAAEAVEWIEPLYRERPGDLPVASNLGEALRLSGRAAEAVDILQKVAQLSPGVSSPLNQLGNALLEIGRTPEAIGAFEQAIRAQPINAKAWYNLARARRADGDLRSAIEAAQHATRLSPDWADAWNNLGAVHQIARDLARAIDAFRTALRLDPGAVEARTNLAMCLRDLGALTEAETTLQVALARRPGSASLQAALGSIRRELGDVAGADAGYEAAVRLAPREPRFRSALLFLRHTTETMPSEGTLQLARSWGTLVRPAPPRSRPAPSPVRDRLRIGYLSPDFRSHAVARFIGPLLGAHSRRKVEVFALSCVARPDEVTAALRSRVEHWVDVPSGDDARAARTIESLGLDVLVDLAGHTRDNRLPILAHRPARVQATYLGYVGTTGLQEVDWWITDQVLHPPGSERHSTEKPWRLPRCWATYEPPTACPDPAPPFPARPTFGSFNHLSKVVPSTIALWTAALEAVPDAHLLIKSRALDDGDVRAHILRRFAAHGVPPERILLRGHTPGLPAHFAAYGEVDVALDPFPYSGTTTTCDALWMGVPVVTLAGATFASRVSMRILEAVGEMGTSTTLPAEFGRIAAAALAAERSETANLRRDRRRDRRQRFAASELADAPNLAASLETAFSEMVNGRTPV